MTAPILLYSGDEPKNLALMAEQTPEINGFIHKGIGAAAFLSAINGWMKTKDSQWRGLSDQGKLVQSLTNQILLDGLVSPEWMRPTVDDKFMIDMIDMVQRGASAGEVQADMAGAMGKTDAPTPKDARVVFGNKVRSEIYFL